MSYVRFCQKTIFYLNIVQVICQALSEFPNFSYFSLIEIEFSDHSWLMAEAVVGRCSVEKVLLEISYSSQENTCARVFF